MQPRPSASTLERSLVAAGVVIWLAAAVDPVDRAAWLLENVLLAVGVTWVLATYRRWRLSPGSYLLIFAFLVLHIVGAHYTYSATPAGEWMRMITGADRNHYDRAVHFLFGLLLVSPFRDQVERAARLTTCAAWGVGILIITSLSAVYELMEWATAVLISPDNAIVFLGTQGDVFDSQKDTALAILGALLGLAITLAAQRLGSPARLMRGRRQVR